MIFLPLTTETEGNGERTALNPPVFSWSVLFEFSFCGEKTRFTHVIAANKRANSHNFKIKKLNLLTITFLAIYTYWTEVKPRQWINPRWEWIILSNGMMINTTCHRLHIYLPIQTKISSWNPNSYFVLLQTLVIIEKRRLWGLWLNNMLLTRVKKL